VPTFVLRVWVEATPEVRAALGGAGIAVRGTHPYSWGGGPPGTHQTDVSLDAANLEDAARQVRDVVGNVPIQSVG
jgi:hypothetical protein